jgi:hypothetical protein
MQKQALDCPEYHFKDWKPAREGSRYMHMLQQLYHIPEEADLNKSHVCEK